MNRVSKRSANEAADALLDAGRTQPALDYDVDLGLARHQHWLRNEAPMPEWASAGLGTATKASFATLALKTLVSSLLVGVLAVVAWNVRDRLQPSAASAPPLQAAAPSVSHPAEPAPKPIPVPEPSLPSEPPVRRAVQTQAQDKDKRATRSHRQHKEHARSVRTQPEEVATPAAPMAAPVAAALPSPSADTAPREAPTPEPKRKPAPPPRPQAKGPDDLLEMQEVAKAEQLLERSPERALALVRQGDQRFAQGYFQQERAYVAIMALIRLGRIEEARSRAGTFAKRFPALPYGARIRSALDAAGAR